MWNDSKLWWISLVKYLVKKTLLWLTIEKKPKAFFSCSFLVKFDTFCFKHYPEKKICFCITQESLGRHIIILMVAAIFILPWICKIKSALSLCELQDANECDVWQFSHWGKKLHKCRMPGRATIMDSLRWKIGEFSLSNSLQCPGRINFDSCHGLIPFHSFDFSGYCPSFDKCANSNDLLLKGHS